jgi:RNA polymerase sigma-70 factor, ECF subfamily
MVSAQHIRNFLELYAAHEVRLRALALALVPSWDGANDLVQETNVVLWEKFASFSPGSNFFAWAAVIMKLKAKEYWRRRARERLQTFGDGVLCEVAAEAVEMSELLVARERALHHCISKLGEEQLQVLRIRYVEGASIFSVSEALGRTEVAVRKALSRIRKALSDCINRHLKIEGTL